VWWFKDVVLVAVLSLLFFGVQWYADERRQHGVDQLEDRRQISVENSDNRRQSEDNRRENLRFVRERASADPTENRPFANLDLEQLTLKGLALPNAKFGEAILNGADLRGTVLTAVDFDRAQLNGAHLNGAILNGASFRGAQLVGVTLPWAKLGCPLRIASKDDPRAKCPEGSPEEKSVHLDSASLIGAVLHDADLEGANLWAAKLIVADLRGSDLTETVLTSVKAHGADFGCIDDPVVDNPNFRTNPRCTDLTGAVLHNADLTYANLFGAKLDYVTIGHQTNLTGVRGLEDARLDNVCYESGTTWPLGFTPPPARVTDCYTSESLKATIMELSSAVHQRRAAEPALYVSSRCLSLKAIEVIEWLGSWDGRTTPGDTIAGYVFGPFNDRTARSAIGRWVFNDEIRRWQWDGCPLPGR
jgi:uncharacterized protein YjbI with pentapeptide repeats